MKKFLVILSIIFICLSFFCYSDFSSDNTKQVEIVDSVQIQKMKIDSIENELITNVSNYIKEQAPNSHDSLSIYLVKYALNYDIDLCFMMSQTEIETNYGTLGAGRETSKKSLFGVHIYPNTPFKGYPDYDSAIEAYCKLLKKSYLVKGRDEHFLMNNYINSSGNRYASDSTYENALKMKYNIISKNTNINELQSEYIVLTKTLNKMI
jgi:flagellum-specific peptidoglycan hydrolase FlgJ